MKEFLLSVYAERWHHNTSLMSHVISLNCNVHDEIPAFSTCEEAFYLLLESNSVDELCRFVFAQLATNYDTACWLCSRTILCPTSADVDKVNNLIIAGFPGEATEYKSSDSVVENEHQYSIEFLNSLTPSDLPPHWLLLKKHISVMLLHAQFRPLQWSCQSCPICHQGITQACHCGCCCK